MCVCVCDQSAQQLNTVQHVSLLFLSKHRQEEEIAEQEMPARDGRRVCVCVCVCVLLSPSRVAGKIFVCAFKGTGLASPALIRLANANANSM